MRFSAVTALTVLTPHPGDALAGPVAGSVAGALFGPVLVAGPVAALVTGLLASPDEPVDTEAEPLVGLVGDVAAVPEVVTPPEQLAVPTRITAIKTPTTVVRVRIPAF